MSNENSLIQAEETPSMLAMIARASSDPNVDIDKFERMVALKERMDAKTAEADFNAAMTRAQSQMRPVSADSSNPQTRSKYASYAKLDKALRPIYTDQGFSLSYDTDDSPKPEHVRVLCYVSHSGGHTRTYKADMPADGKGAKGNDVMTKTHAFGAGTSYGMRYLLKMIFNVAIGEDDNDGNDYNQVQYITEDQESIIRDLMEAYVKKPKAFKEYLSNLAGYEVGSLAVIPAKHFNTVHRYLKEMASEHVSD